MIDLKIGYNDVFETSNDITKHDLIISNGDLVLASDSEEVAQAVNIKLKTRQGEFTMDVLAGIDYDELYASSTSLALKEALIMDALYTTYGVKKINSLSTKIDKLNFTLFVEFNIDTLYTENQALTFVI